MSAMSRLSKFSVAHGLVISLAVTFAGKAALAEGLTEFGAATRPYADTIGDFSANDLAKLEHASSAQATAARLAAMGVKTVAVAKTVRTSVSVDAPFATQANNDDLFPHSARVLPMIVARPQAEPSIGSGVIAPRPGVAQPVGVAWSSLRPRTPAEKAAR